MAKINMNKPIGKLGHLPEKAQVNLIRFSKKKFFTRRNTLLVIALALILVAGVFFGVIRPYSNMVSYETTLARKQDELQTVKANVNARYNTVANEYAKYDRSFLKRISRYDGVINRIELLDEIERLLSGRIVISNANFTRNTVSFSVSEVSMKAFAEVQTYLKALMDNKECSLTDVTTGPYTIVSGYDTEGESLIKVNMQLTFEEGVEK